MKVLRSKLVAVAEALGCPTAAKWNKPKTISRFRDLMEHVDGTEIEDKELKPVLDAVKAEADAGRLDDLQVVDDVGKPEVTAAFVEEHGGFTAAGDLPAAASAEGGPGSKPESEGKAEEAPTGKPAKAKKSARKAAASAAGDAEPAETKAKQEKRVSPLDSMIAAIKGLKKTVTKAELVESAAKIHREAGGDEKQDAKIMMRYLREPLILAEAFGAVSVDGDKVTPVGR